MTDIYDLLTNLKLTTSFVKFDHTTPNRLKDEGWIDFF